MQVQSLGTSSAEALKVQLLAKMAREKKTHFRQQQF